MTDPFTQFPRVVSRAVAGVPCAVCGGEIQVEDAGALIERPGGESRFEHAGCVAELDPWTVWAEAAFADRYHAARARGLSQTRAAGVAGAAVGVRAWYNQRDGVAVYAGFRVVLFEKVQK